ncbi:ribosomal-protein-alanine N-acetyltransferase [Alkalibacillus flavidus]|uniref:[Ribosomal protein bS18]-alanine N-acetyltransferase n=1 Tax=Alkalibacillus flavidus TaxID=546021 RepID=A0ABV2KUK9_9BACI
MGEVRVRKMEITDLDDIMSVEHASFAAPWRRDDFEVDLVKNRFSYYLVLEKDDQIIGYCGVWIVLETAQITNVAILPSERGHGYGEQLFRHVLKLARQTGAEELSLEVRQSNIVAQKMYQKFGLKIVARRENYYPDHEDAYVMWVKLQ